MMFTQVCLKDPARAVKLYLDISEKSKAESVIKLMTDTACFSDCCNIIRGMPKYRLVRVSL